MHNHVTVERPSPQELIARAETLAAKIASRRREIESGCWLPDDIIEDIADAQFPLVLVPKARGGFEYDLDTVSAIVRPVAAVCTSAGWNLCFYMGTNWMVCQFPKEAQDKYFAQGRKALLAGSAIPTCSLVPVDGGYRVSGRGSWLSGSVHSSHVLFAGRVADGAAPGAPEIRSIIVPSHEVERLKDTWQMEAMRATGSIDGVLKDVFVPQEHTLQTEKLMNGEGASAKLYPNNPMYARPADLMPLCYILPVFVGAARGAADLLLSLNKDRVNSHTGASAAGRTSIQMHVGSVQARALVAEEMLESLIRFVMNTDDAQLRRPERKVELKTRGAMIVDYCRDIVNEATQAAGANAFRKEAALQMLFRDINMIALHPFFEKDTLTEAYGKTLLMSA